MNTQKKNKTKRNQTKQNKTKITQTERNNKTERNPNKAKQNKKDSHVDKIIREVANDYLIGLSFIYICMLVSRSSPTRVYDVACHSKFKTLTNFPHERFSKLICHE